MITGDWQAELRGVTVGTDDYVINGPITGLGVAPPRTADQERGLQPGDVAGFDIAARRIITVPVAVNGSGPVEGWELFETLKTAWAPSITDLAFDLRLPGFASMSRRYYGRPRGLDDDLALLRLGVIYVLATFEALDPYAYGSEVEVALTGTTTVTNPGSAATDRYVIVVDVTAAPVTIANTADGEPSLTLDAAVTGTVVLDGRDRTIVDDGGLDLYGHLTAGSGWPVLTPGANPVTVTGGTATITFEPAYL